MCTHLISTALLGCVSVLSQAIHFHINVSRACVSQNISHGDLQSFCSPGCKNQLSERQVLLNMGPT